MVTLTEDPGIAGMETEPSPLPQEEMGSISREGLRQLTELVPLAGNEGPPLQVISPGTGAMLAEYPHGTPATVSKAVRRARRAQSEWAETNLVEREAVLMRYHDLILAHREEILDLIQLETGKARKSAFEEVADVALVSRYYGLNAERHLGPHQRKGALPGLTSTWEHHRPKGVVGFISPWNYPLSMAITDALPALVAGNGAVLKPDQQTPFTALWALQLLHRAGLPYDLFQIVTGKGSELGTPLIDQVDYVAFTGSTKTGRIVARQAAERLIGCSLELGGKNPMIVLADADLESAVEGAIRGCFANAGQLCISIERLYIAESVFERFTQRLAARVSRMTLGSQLDFEADMGSLVSQAQLEKVEAHVLDAVTKGAKVLAGGRARPDIGPYFFEPTVLQGVTEEMEICSEETFGPVVSVSPFDSVEEAIERANDSRYGLNAAVWTSDAEVGRELAARIEAGTVNVNEAYAATWGSIDAPMGGFKESGLGRRHGAEGILKYTEAQTISVQRGMPIASPAGVGEKDFSELMTGALRLLRWIPGLR
ncbi:MAG: succinic semialdehyde dehydrogenase [Thermoanaerobaculia bacterium]